MIQLTEKARYKYDPHHPYFVCLIPPLEGHSYDFTEPGEMRYLSS